jgi:hypothetical protein
MWKTAATILILLLGPSWLYGSPSSALSAAVADAARLPPTVRVLTRYLDLSALPPTMRADAIKTLAFHTNQLSRNPEFVRPRAVNDELLAVVLTDYGWKSTTWEKLANIEPYYHVQLLEQWPGGYSGATFYKPGRYRTPAAAPWLDAKQIAYLIIATQSQAPIVRADWWFVQSARQLSLDNNQTGAGYYDWLGITKRADFERLVKLNAKDSIEIGKEIRAAVERSGVATQNRQIVRLQALTGGYWTTLDTDDSTGRGNAIRNLGRGDYQHLAEEIYAPLSNGLFAYFLGDVNGKRQDSAPDFIGADDSPLRSGKDARIHVCKSCIACHTDGLRSIDDWVRRTLRSPLGLQSPDYAKYVELRRQYFSNLDRQLNRDREVYADAVKELTGWTTGANAIAFANLWNWYAIRDRSLEDIAREIGRDPAAFRAALQTYAAKTGTLDLVLAGLLQDPQSRIRVEMVEELMPVIYQAAGYR